MESYISPYTISERMLEQVSSISEKIGKITSHKELESKPHLRRNNRIRSIHSSLKIEANSLSLNEVRDVINGNLVIGDQKEIQEVKNAYAAYEKISEIDPSSVKQLKEIHGIMTHLTVEESGVFRKGDEGVFSGDKCIFVAPPPNMVPELMKELLSWIKKYDVPYTSNDIMERLGLKSKETLRKNYLNPAMELGLIRMTIPDKPNSRNQRYVKQ